MQEQTGAQDTQRSSENTGPTDKHVTGVLIANVLLWCVQVPCDLCTCSRWPSSRLWLIYLCVFYLCRRAQDVLSTSSYETFYRLKPRTCRLTHFCCRWTFLLSRLLTIPTYLGLDYWISTRNHEVTDGKST